MNNGIHYYSIFDKKANSFDTLIQLDSDNREAAIRWFSMIMSRDDLVKTNPILARYPDDFDLYYVGCFDQESGEFFGKREYVCNAGELTKVVVE